MFPSRSWGALALAWGATVAVLAVWLLRTPAPLLREQLKVLQFWSLELTVVIAVVLIALVAPALFKGFDRRDGFRIAMLGGFALALTLLVAPRTNRIYYDEQIYEGVAQNLADTRLAQMCNDGTVEYGRLQCWIGQYNKQPYAYPHLLSLVYRATGVHESAAFLVNAAAMALTAMLVYLLAWLLFGDRDAALLSGLLISVMPEQIMWSATAAVEPTASLAAIAALVMAAHFARSRSTLALLGTVTLAAYAVQFRPESFLILLPIAVLCYPTSVDEFRRRRLWWAGLLFLTLVAVHLGHSIAVRNEGWGTNDARLSFGYVLTNLRVNGRFYLGDERFPAIITLLAALGLAVRGGFQARAALLVYFLVFWGIDLLFYAGSYNYGADVRYSLMTYPPLAILGGVGASAVVRRLGITVFRTGMRWQLVAVAAILFQFLEYAPLVRSTTEEAWAARADVRFAQSVASQLPPNSYVLTHNPGMFHLWRVNAGQLSLVAGNPRYLDHLQARYTGGVYLHWNFWCNVGDPVQSQFCRTVLDGLPGAEKVSEYRERDQRFALYKLPAPSH